jgi:hypothetical protein
MMSARAGPAAGSLASFCRAATRTPRRAW